MSNLNEALDRGINFLTREQGKLGHFDHLIDMLKAMKEDEKPKEIKIDERKINYAQADAIRKQQIIINHRLGEIESVIGGTKRKWRDEVDKKIAILADQIVMYVVPGDKPDEKPEDNKLEMLADLHKWRLDAQLGMIEELKSKVEALESNLIKPHERKMMEKVDEGIEDFRRRLEELEKRVAELEKCTSWYVKVNDAPAVEPEHIINFTCPKCNFIAHVIKDGNRYGMKEVKPEAKPACKHENVVNSIPELGAQCKDCKEFLKPSPSTPKGDTEGQTLGDKIDKYFEEECGLDVSANEINGLVKLIRSHNPIPKDKIVLDRKVAEEWKQYWTIEDEHKMLNPQDQKMFNEIRKQLEA